MTEPLDPRLNAVRSDLADRRLAGRVECGRFADGRPARVAVPVADLHREPANDAPLDTQLLFGERVHVFERRKGWAWIQADDDGYVGYIRDGDLGEVEDATHRVTAMATFLYPVPDLKSVPLARLSIGSLLAVKERVETRGLDYAAVGAGFIVAKHIAPADAHGDDFVAIAERFRTIPYLWAGRSSLGVDCSGLVQLAMAMAGRRVLRDSDMQEGTIGESVADGVAGALKRGDLVFWIGHVGIMRDDTQLLHANGNTMDVTVEPLDDAIGRIEPLYGAPTSVRRPPALSAAQ